MTVTVRRDLSQHSPPRQAVKKWVSCCLPGGALAIKLNADGPVAGGGGPGRYDFTHSGWPLGVVFLPELTDSSRDYHPLSSFSALPHEYPGIKDRVATAPRFIDELFETRGLPLLKLDRQDASSHL